MSNSMMMEGDNFLQLGNRNNEDCSIFFANFPSSLELVEIKEV